jgi:hypothetical protein
LSFSGLKFSNGNTAMLFSSGSAAADFCREYNQMIRVVAASKTKVAAIAKYIARNLLGARLAATLAPCSDCDCPTIFGNSGFPTPFP